MEENTVITEQAETAVESAPQTFTADEVAKLIQSETDKRVSQALKTREKQYQKELSLSRLDGAEREKAEKDNRIAELEEKLAQFEVEKNKSELKSVLASRGLSAEFADLIKIDDNLEESQSRIDTLDKLFKKAVQIEVEKRLAGNAPKGNIDSQQFTDKDIRKMSLAELQKLEQTNPEVYKRYFG